MYMANNELQGIADRLRELIKLSDYNQKSLADRVGLSENQMGNILKGKTNFKVLSLVELKNALNTDYDYILEGKVNEVNDQEVVYMKKRIEDLESDKERLYKVIESK